MSEQIIFYNIDSDKVVIIPITEAGGKETLTEPDKLAELGLKIPPTADEAADLITADTFTLVFSDHGEPISMTYNEWETLRSKQANQQIQAKIKELAIDSEEKAKLEKIFTDFTEGMRIKYLGQKSWTSIYEDLFENLK